MLDAAMRVVVVDDDEDWRDLVVELLHQQRLEAIGFGDGRAALAAMRGPLGLPSVILLDLEMPAMTGWEFRREQLADARLASVPVVICSSADPESLHASAYLGKPFEPGELLEVLGSVAARARAA